MDEPGRPPSPEVYEIGGVSEGPLVTMVDSANLCYWRLGDVMTAVNTSFEIFYATRVGFILPDGTLKGADVERRFSAISAGLLGADSNRV